MQLCFPQYVGISVPCLKGDISDEKAELQCSLTIAFFSVTLNIPLFSKIFW